MQRSRLRLPALALVCLVTFVPPALARVQPGITLKAENAMKGRDGAPRGWGAGGWGSYRFTLKNATAADATIVHWTASWEAKGKRMSGSWGGDLDVKLPAGKEVVRDEVGVLPAGVARAAAPDAAQMVGSFVVRQGDRQIDLPYRMAVPEARLAEPLKLVKGKTVGLELMQSRFSTFHQLDRTLRWVDQAYAQMIDLTGEKPFGGKLMVFKEAPAHPWWAYAGQQMILNTDYVGSTLKEFDDGLISFGWIHEVGHNFDEQIGKWYIWSGPAAEWQANFKLCYAFETIADQSFRIRWTFQAPGYPAPDKNTRLTGHELVEKFFVMFGDAYLADPARKWDTLSSDEMHTFFQRVEREYGWDVFKRWYRTYRRLEDAGKKPPEKAEDKIALIAAILSRESGIDLVPVFVRWRLPVTAESVKAMREQYGIEAPVGPAK